MADKSSNIPYGYCQCGCGLKTPIASKSRLKDGIIKGKPTKFVHGHNLNYTKIGKDHHSWKGGRIITDQGYIKIKCHNHPRANNGYVSEHIVICEKVIGKPLPPKAVIHHVNGNNSDNRHTNLVICENDIYHRYLHQRYKAYKSCGKANWRKCQHCKQYDDINNLKSYGIIYHQSCRNEYQKQRRLKIKSRYKLFLLFTFFLRVMF